MKLALNMIVKNEIGRIERLLASVIPYIDYAIIVDTGSTDATVNLIELTLSEAGIDHEIHSAPFKNFSQARNIALAFARRSSFKWDYLLVCDADMELMVTDKDFKSKLVGKVVSAVQKGSGLSYHNVRFISRSSSAVYVSPTHEYYDDAVDQYIEEVYFNDYADGANRPGKFVRDISMLKEAIRQDQTNGRYWYYLGQSYADAGQTQKAIGAFTKRIEIGGWAEEVWSAYVRRAHCYKTMGNTAKFISGLLDAYNYRPSRAEPLYDLARYYREKGATPSALLLAEAGLKIPYPSDLLFVNDFPYSTGFREEISISAFYNPAKREEGFRMCNSLALDKTISPGSRDLAAANLFHYIQPLAAYIPSFSAKKIEFTPDDGYAPLNPSIINRNGRLQTIVRSVNYMMDEQGRYMVLNSKGEAQYGEAAYWVNNPIRTVNYLLDLTNKFDVVGVPSKILLPEGFPAPAYGLVLGFEDMRLFEWRGELWTSSTLREQNADGVCQQFLARISHDENTGHRRLDQWECILSPAPSLHEKNWMPWVIGNDLSFSYRLNKTIDRYGAVCEYPTSFYIDNISGGSQVIWFNGGFIAVVHQAGQHPHNGKRWYQHRFAWFDRNKVLRTLSRPFVFHDKAVEFAAGLAWHTYRSKLVISYGRGDKEAWVASIDTTELMEFLFHA